MANSKLTVHFGKKTYIIEYNRRILIEMEEDGLIDKLQGKSSIKNIYELAYHGFTLNQPDITKEEVYGLIDQIDDLTGFIEAVGQLVKNCVEAVKNGEKVGNATWEMK